MEKLNNKGFTLVELIAVIAILAIIMTITIPNVVGFLDRNTRSTYIEQAKKMVALAEAEYRSNTGLSGNVIVITLGDLGSSDIVEGPEGWDYDKTNSYVILYDDPSTSVVDYDYYVTLVETDGASSSGLPLVHRDILYGDDSLSYVNNSKFMDLISGGSVSAINSDDSTVTINIPILSP